MEADKLVKGYEPYIFSGTKMKSLDGLGIGLSLAFGCLLLALVGELLYFLFWWKKRITNTQDIEEVYYNNYCWKKHSNLQAKNNQAKSVDPIQTQVQEPDLELGTSMELPSRASLDEENVEAELMRLHNFSGPPRFLSTIKEETKEDLESDDGKSRGERSSRKGSMSSRRLSDLVLTIDTPILTPLASPKLGSPSLDDPNLDYYRYSVDVEINRLSSSVLRDAEEKLIRRLIEEAEKRVSPNCSLVQEFGVRSGGEVLHHLTQNPSGSSQTLPLASFLQQSDQ